jgi:hypothetical protein
MAPSLKEHERVLPYIELRCQTTENPDVKTETVEPSSDRGRSRSRYRHPDFRRCTVTQEIIAEPKESIVKDEQILGLYDEILNDCREDSKKVDEVLANFLDMVMNDGDASSASKEAIVNLLKIKSDISDKKAKIADLETRIKLKEKDTFPRYLAAHQQNNVVIEGSKREMIKSINKLAQRKKGV